MEKLSRQDFLRHDSPFKQGVCQSSTALWGRWSQPCSLRSSNQRRLRFLSQHQHSSSFSLGLFRLSIHLYLSPFLSPAGSAPSAPSVPDCVILPAALLLSFSIYVVDAPGPSVRASRCHDPLPHCVLPEASARTRCRLIASSRNPATFSMSSSFMKA